MKYDLSTFEPVITIAGEQQATQGKGTLRFRMMITFVDKSVLHIRENYVIATGDVDYAYHWQTAEHQLIHRWDNAHDVPFSTSPHHQHINTQENVVASEPMTLEKVLTFIASQLTSG